MKIKVGKNNIVLIGLMGSGKSTIGKRLSEMLGMPFTDVDEYIERHYGTIKSLFEKGESHFRNIESLAIEALSKKSGIIISTGGGVVLRQSNMDALKSNGVVFYLERPIEEIIRTIAPAGRPLLKNGTQALYAINRIREPLYLKYGDYRIRTGDIDGTASEIASLWRSTPFRE